MNKGAKAIQWKKDSIFIEWYWLNLWLSCRRMRIKPLLYPCTNLRSKWIKELHIKTETVKLIEDKVGKSLEDMGTGEIFLQQTAMQTVRQKTPSIRQKGQQQIGKELYLS
jgi:hypothetical protein